MKIIDIFWRTSLRSAMLVLVIATMSQCGKGDEPEPKIIKSSDKQIISFKFLAVENPIDINVEGIIDEEQKTITVTMPPGTALDELLPVIEISPEAAISPNTVQDFTNPRDYTVTAEDGSQVVYTAIVTVAMSQREVLQAILDANPGNTLGWDLQNTADLFLLEGVNTDVEGNILELTLNNKNLRSLPSEVRFLKSLRSLNLADNQFKDFPIHVTEISGLLFLSFNDNQIVSLPRELGKLTDLDYLFLGGNQLTSLPSEIGLLTKLSNLNLNSNQLTTLPSEIGQLTALVQLTAVANNLSSLPPELGQLINLKYLIIGINSITSLPSEIGKMTSLEFLEIDANKLTFLPPELGQLTQLTYLNFLNNRVTALPPEIGQLAALKSLHMQENKLSTLPSEIGQLAELTTLNIHKNELTSLPPEVGFLSTLTHLDITDNNISAIPQSVCYLKDFNKPSMNFSHDGTAVCKTTSQMDALISIYSANPGNTLGWGFDNFPGVTFWDDGSPRLIEIENKGVQRITSGVGTFASLRLLDVRSNPLTFIAPEVCKLQTSVPALTILADSGEGCN